jgi:flavin reductase (DIM6/NTAB) family NADH-FMN oxidoreductase RutF
MKNFSLESDPTEALKATFRRHASGVAIITMINSNGSPVGLTATSVTSLGATPPLLTFNVASGASSWPTVCEKGFVAIHTLGVEDVELARKLAGPKAQRFEADDWTTGPHNLPIFTAASAILIGKIREVHDVEANAVVVVDVLEGLVGSEKGGLLYHQRNFVGIGDILS